MTGCKECGLPIDWGWDSVTDKWVPLEPTATHADLSKAFVDESGEFRADHRERHKVQGVNIMRLGKKVPPDLEPEPDPPKTRRRSKRAA